MAEEIKNIDGEGLRQIVDRHYIGQRLEEVCQDEERIYLIFENGRSLMFRLSVDDEVNLWTGERPPN